MNEQERKMELKKLRDIQKRARKGTHLHKDYEDMVSVLIKLVKDK